MLFLGSTDITQPNFNPYYYLLAHKSNAKYVNFVNINISTWLNNYSFDELRKNLEHLKRTQVDNKGASTTLVKNNIASFMEAVDIMKGLFIYLKMKNKNF